MSRSIGQLAGSALCVALAVLGVFRLFHDDFLQWQVNISGFNDYQPLYLGTRAWVTGLNPYSAADVLRELKITDPSAYPAGSKDLNTQLVLYPPTAFPITALVAFLPWKTAYTLQIFVSALSYVWMLTFLSLRIGNLWYDRRRQYLLAFGLAMAPFHYGLMGPNISVVVTSGICLAMAAITEAPVLAGLTIGVCLALKPQVGMLFLLHMLLTRRWRPFAIATATAALALAIGLGWMASNGVEWSSSYRNNIATLTSSNRDGSNGIVRNGSANFALINLQPLVYLFTRDVGLSNLITYCIFVVVFLSYFVTVLKKLPANLNGDLIYLGIVSSLTLLPIYQRYYNAILLLFTLSWALSTFNQLFSKIIVLAMTTLLHQFIWTPRPYLQLFARPSANWLVFLIGPAMIWYLHHERWRAEKKVIQDPRSSCGGLDVRSI